MHMNKSENIDLLASALSKLQGEITDVTKDKKGYGYQYADLSQILDISRPMLSKHKLAISQLCGSAHDKVTVETVLMHESGQWISSTIEMGVQEGKGMSLAQAVGSVITYARRYALASIIGIAQIDNDAHVEQAKPVKRVDHNIYKEFAELISSRKTDPEVINGLCAKQGVTTIYELPKELVTKAVERLRLQ